MKEKLIIKNFGPIKSVELEFGRMNVLIGEQATGKSTVAKLLAVCRYFSYIVSNGSFEHDMGNQFSEGLITWGLQEGVKDDSHIYYECKHYSLSVDSLEYPIKHSKEKGYKVMFFVPEIKPISKEFIDLLSELESMKPKNLSSLDEQWITPTSFYQNEVSKVLDNPFYLPAERGLQSIFSLGKNSIQNISDSLFNQFAKIDQIARLFKKETAIEPLGITYRNDDGKGYIRKDNEEASYSVFNAASGYQSTIPVVLLTKYYSEIRKKPKTFIIEEPELNLFPEAQHKLMEYMVDRTINYGNTTLLNTHSPYILTSLNNMLYAYQIGQKHNEEVEKVIEKRYWLNPEDVAAYMMLPDGTCENIFDREEGLIKAEAIDGISKKLNEQFNTLLNIEFEK